MRRSGRKTSKNGLRNQNSSIKDTADTAEIHQKEKLAGVHIVYGIDPCFLAQQMASEDQYLLRTSDLTKIYSGVIALQRVSIGFKEGEVHAIVGENGAGKSTLIKILSGAVAQSSGDVFFKERRIENWNPKLALKMGIGVIYQEFNFFPSLTVTDNLFMGRELKKRTFLDKKAMERKAQQDLAELGIKLDTRVEMRKLAVAYQQMVQICKTISSKVRVLVLDEPTAPLTEKEIFYLFKLIKKLRADGVCVVYISHRLDEIFQIADRVSVLRDGLLVTTRTVSEVDKEQLIGFMVGRKIDSIYPYRKSSIKEIILEVKNIRRANVLDKASFCLRKGEILGISGLIGSGRTELARSLFGADRVEGGHFILKGKEVRIKSVSDAISYKIGLIPEDRKSQGLILNQTVKNNITYSNLKCYCKWIFIRSKKELDEATKLAEKLAIRTPSLNQKVRNLSGGNQQKVVLAKWLATDSEILIFDEPTRGIDVNAKQEVYKLLCELAEEGRAIIMISSEMPELIGMSDRIIVMSRGKITGTLEKNEVTQEKLLMLAAENL